MCKKNLPSIQALLFWEKSTSAFSYHARMSVFLVSKVRVTSYAKASAQEEGPWGRRRPSRCRRKASSPMAAKLLVEPFLTEKKQHKEGTRWAPTSYSLGL